eukprot:403354567
MTQFFFILRFLHEIHGKNNRCNKNRDHPDELAPKEYNGLKTIWDAYERTVRRIPNNQHLGTRNYYKEGAPYEWKTYGEIFEASQNFAKGLQALELCPSHEEDGKQFAFLGVHSKNREEWAIAGLGCLSSDVTIVPVYESLGADALGFIINQTELTTMCMEKKALNLFIKMKKSQKSHAIGLLNLICFDNVTDDDKQQAQEADLKLFNISEIIEYGSQTKVNLERPKPDSIYIICYTSGTTGDPKGVMLTHGSFISCLHLSDWVGVQQDETDVHLSYLPYGHTFEQCDPLKLLDDLRVLRPTIFLTVPRILNRVYSKVQESVQAKGGISEWLFNKAVNAKIYNYENGGSLTHMVYDSLVFKKVKEHFGGRVKIMISASAPISPEVLTFFKIALGVFVFEVYGQTETYGPATVTHPQDFTSGHVGGIIPSMKLRLKDLSELGYMSTDDPPRGEVQFYGQNIFSGYFKNPEKTKEAFSEDGWVNSGDVGVILPNGALKIIDRTKNIFKLSQGEYIAPEKLENIYTQCHIIAQIFVYGDSLQHFLVAIIVPDHDQVRKFAEENGIEQQGVYQNQEFKEQVIAQMMDKAKEYNLSSLEKIKKIHLHPTPFTVDNDLITPTFKIKRNVAKKVFQEQLDKLYAEPL